MAEHLSRGTLAVLLASLVVHVALLVATGTTWNHQHDEGNTYDIALAEWDDETELDDPRPLRELQSQIDGSRVATPAEVVRALSHPTRMQHPPAFYLLFNAWVRVTGTGTVPARIPQYVLSALTVLGIAALARRLVSHPSAAGWAAVLAAVNPWLVELSNFLRPYSLALCAAVFGTILLLRAVEYGRRRDVACFAAVSLFGVYTIYHYAFVFGWHLALLALAAARPSSRVRMRAPAFALLTVALGFAPWYLSFARHAESAGDGSHYFSGLVPPGELPVRFSLLIERFAIGQVFPLPVLAWSLGLALLPLSLRAFRRSAAPTRAASLAWATSLLLPVLIELADLAQGTGTLMVTKYSFGLFPLLVLLVVRAWTGGVGGRAAKGGLGFTAALFLTAAVHAAHDARTSPSHVRRVVTAIARADGGEHLVFLSRSTRGHVLPFLLESREQGLREARIAIHQGPELVAAVQRAMSDPDTTRLTLINFVVVLGEAESQWSSDVIAEVRREARRMGWDVRRCRPDELDSEPDRALRSLTIVSPVRAWTYHRRRAGG